MRGACHSGEGAKNLAGTTSDGCLQCLTACGCGGFFGRNADDDVDVVAAEAVEQRLLWNQLHIVSSLTVEEVLCELNQLLVLCLAAQERIVEVKPESGLAHQRLVDVGWTIRRNADGHTRLDHNPVVRAAAKETGKTILFDRPLELVNGVCGRLSKTGEEQGHDKHHPSRHTDHLGPGEFELFSQNSAAENQRDGENHLPGEGESGAGQNDSDTDEGDGASNVDADLHLLRHSSRAGCGGTGLGLLGVSGDAGDGSIAHDFLPFVLLLPPLLRAAKPAAAA
jgi:hypothetical protein